MPDLSMPIEFAANSRTRVADNTDPAINERIWNRTRKSVEHYALLSREEITERLEQLDHEWDIERVLELNASALALFGLGAGTTVAKRYLALSVVVMGFLLQHAVQGWCPPLPVLRQLGFRTANEIEEERYALKALRGDFATLAERVTSTEELLSAIRD